MRNQVINVNTDASIILTAKLERLNKSAFPNSVRSTLNDASFEMKRINILQSAKVNMTVRNPAFFKRYTGVKRATGFNVNSMYSEVGFSNSNDIKAKKALIGMEHNEVGGTDKDGGMYVGKTRGARGLVKRNSRFDRNKVLNTKTKSNVARMYASAKAKKQVFINTSRGRFLVQARSFKSGGNGGSPDVKLDFLMRNRKQHIAYAKATHFVKESAIVTSKQIEGFYAKNSEYEFNKVLKSTR